MTDNVKGMISYVTYTPTSQGWPRTFIIIRDEEKKRHIFQLDHSKEENRPYFYADPIEYENVKHMISTKYLASVEPDRKDLFGRRLTKVIVGIPSEVSQVRDKFTWTNEADIEWRYRTLIDMNLRLHIERKDGKLLPIDNSTATLNHGYIDIEVGGDSTTFPDWERATEPVCLVTMTDWYHPEPIVLLLKNPEWKDPEAWKATSYGSRTILFDTEEELLKYCFSLIKSQQMIIWRDGTVEQHGEYDTITGWNIWFDIAYLWGRAKKLGVDPNTASPLGYWYNQGGREDSWKIGGIEIFDGLSAVKKWNESNSDLSSWNYQFVKGHFLGEEYKRFSPASNIQSVWTDDIEELIRYGYEDGLDYKKLFAKLNIFEYFDGIRRLVGVFYSDALSNLKVVNIWTYRKAKSIGVCLPTIRYKKKQSDAKGAVVFQPPVGIHSWIGVADVKSLYPSLIKTYNISPETIVPDPIEFIEGTPKVQKKNWIDVDYPTVELPNGVRFRLDKRGLIPLIIDEAEAWRDEYRELMRKYQVEGNIEMAKMYDINQNTAKYLNSSVYGVQGNEAYVLRSDIGRGCITYMGREIVIPAIKEFLEMHNLKAIYADTDSNFFTIPNVTNFDDAEHVGEEIIKRLNDHLAEVLSTDKIFTKLDKVFERMLFALRTDGMGAAKKNYAGLKRDGTINIMGFPAKRSDSCIVTRDAQIKLFDLLLKQEDKKGAAEYIREMRQKFLNKEMTLSDISVPRGIEKQVHEYSEAAQKHAALRGLKYSIDCLGMRLEGGNKPRYVYVKRKQNVTGYEDTDVITYDDEEKIPKRFWEDFEVDWHEQLNLVLKGKVIGILEAVGIDWGEIETGSRKSSLLDFPTQAKSEEDNYFTSLRIPDNWGTDRMRDLMDLKFAYTINDITEMSGLALEQARLIMNKGKEEQLFKTTMHKNIVYWGRVV